MNPQLTISILAVLLLANSITTLVYWFRLRAMKNIAETTQQYSDKWYQLTLQQSDRISEWRVAYEELTAKLKLTQELLEIRLEQIKKLTNANMDLQSKLNAAKDALK